MKRLSSIGFTLALVAAFWAPPVAGLADLRCGFHARWVPDHWAYYFAYGQRHRRWIRGRCVHFR